MTNRIRWDRSEGGFCDSKENRFWIQPKFSSCTEPQWYEVQDRLNGDIYTADTQRECKEWAEKRVLSEIK